MLGEFCLKHFHESGFQIADVFDVVYVVKTDHLGSFVLKKLLQALCVVYCQKITKTITLWFEIAAHNLPKFENPLTYILCRTEAVPARFVQNISIPG